MRAARKLKGGTLVIVVSAILILLLIGAGVAVLIQIFGGSREANYSMDAAVLNVAKCVSVRPTVNVLAEGLPEFQGLGDGGGDEISVITYNKAVAKTILVALNAEEEKTAAAYASAKNLQIQLDKLNRLLTAKLKNSSEPRDAFDQMTGANFLRMSATKTITRSGDLEWSAIGKGDSSDIYFDPTSLPPGAMAKLAQFLDTSGAKAPNGQPYVKGYTDITLGGVTIQAIPVFPGQQPHLVSLKDFRQGQADNSVAAPPNSLLVNASAGGLMQQAAAVVGALGAGVMSQQPTPTPGEPIPPLPSPIADIPGGYIKIVNLQGDSLRDGRTGYSDFADRPMVFDGDNDIFNKELFSPSRIVESGNGVFTTDSPQMNAWIAFNKGQGPDPAQNGYDVGNMRSGQAPGQPATRSELTGIQNVLCECTHTMYSQELTGPCGEPDRIRKWQTNYRRSSLEGQVPRDPLCYAEEQKVIALQWRASYIYFRQYYGGGGGELNNEGITGLKLFKEGGPYPYPEHPLNFATDGSPAELMAQVEQRNCWNYFGDITIEQIRAALLRQAAQIKPGLTAEELDSVLASEKLGLGKTLFLKKSGDRLILWEPPDEVSRGPDSDGAEKTYAKNVSLEGIVNAPGDANFADAPFSRINIHGNSNGQSGRETIKWRQGTGGKNCLGQLTFQGECWRAQVVGLDCPN